MSDLKMLISGTFRLYDIDKNGSVSKEEMIEIVDAIFIMTGQKYSGQVNTVKKVEQIFSYMDQVSFIY